MMLESNLMIKNNKNNNKSNVKDYNKTNTKSDRKRYKDRTVADPGIPKVGITKQRRRLEDGGKLTT